MVQTAMAATTAMTLQVHHDITNSETCDHRVRYRKTKTIVTTACSSRKNRSLHLGPQPQILNQVQCQL